MTAQYDKNDRNELVIATTDSIYSDVLKEQREFWIHLPENMKEDEKYPIIYVLDAPSHFYAATGMIKLLEQWRLPNSIVVGIPNTDRIRDFTPSNVPFNRGQKSETSGGAVNFLKFMQCELAPHVKNKYPADEMSTIIGHSTGGLFVVYSYVNEPEVFDNYLAIDPSLWWDKEQLVVQSKKLLEKDNYQNKSIHVAVANSYEVDTTKVRRSKSVPTEAIRANLNFHDILVKNRNNLDFSWTFYNEEDHGSIVVPGMYNGLRSLYAWFPFEERWRFNTPKAYSAKELTEPFYTHFEELSIRFKRPIKPEWGFVHDVGFHILETHGLPKKAKAYLDVLVHFYSDESRTYVALGNFYAKEKEKEKAITNYKKAIEIDGNEEAKKKLKALQK